MLTTALLALATFFVARFLGARIVRPRWSNRFGIAAVILFAIGFFTYPAAFGNGGGPAIFAAGAIAQAPAAASAPYGPASKETQPAQPGRLHLSTGQLANLVRGSGQAPIGSLDVLTLSAAAMTNTTGNVFPVGSTLYARGWVADAVTKSPVPGILLTLDYKRMIDGTGGYGGDRPDVAKALGTPSAEFTGFSGVAIRTVGLKRGTHTLQLGEITRSGRHYLLVSTPIMKFTLN